MNILETIGASAIMGTAAIISNGEEIHNVHESIAYVESLDEYELQ